MNRIAIVWGTLIISGRELELFNTISRALLSLVLVSAFSAISMADSSASKSQLAKTAGNCMKTLVLVNAYSSGDNLPEAFKTYMAIHYPNHDVRIVHVHASGTPHSHLADTFSPSKYYKDYEYDGDLDKLMTFLYEFKPDAVMAGSESGVILMDHVTTAFRDRYPELLVPSNGIHEGRRDKLFMGEAVRDAGLYSVKQMATDNAEEARRWLIEKNLTKEVTVQKPRDAAGGNDVRIAHNIDEAVANFKEIHGKINEYGIVNSTVLVQAFMPDAKGLIDAEFVVNTTSGSGKHVVNSIIRYTKKKRGSRNIYSVDRLMPFEGPLQKELVDYTFKVLDSLGIKTGWGHAEIKFTDRGAEMKVIGENGQIGYVDLNRPAPVLIEIGNRMMGSRQPLFEELALGESQLSVGMEAYFSPEKFANRPVGYEFKKSLAVVSINNFELNQHSSHAMTEDVKNLPGYFGHSYYFKDGAAVPETVDMSSSIGHVWLAHPDEATVEASIKKLLDWEDSGKFTKTGPPAEKQAVIFSK